MNLTKYVEFPDELIKRADAFTLEAQKFRKNIDRHHSAGTFLHLMDRYEIDAESPFQELAERTRTAYLVYLKKLRSEIGSVRYDNVTGRDIIKWFNDWSENRTKISVGRMKVAIVKAMVTYGVSCRVEGCTELKEVITSTTRRLPTNKKRTQIITADEVTALIEAAKADGRPSCALTYAFVFETLLRLFDVHQYLDWSHISDGLILEYVPTKTSKRTGLKVTFNLKLAPLVVAELAPILKNGKPKSGPVILRESTGIRWGESEFSHAFRKDREAAGISQDIWARDLRASGITEARLYGTDISDLSKLAGHSTSTTTSHVYDRATLAASERIALNRASKRRNTSQFDKST